VNFINHGKYTIILNGVDAPRIYNGDILFQSDAWTPASVMGNAVINSAYNDYRAAIGDGEFAITIDGVAYDIT
jgi:hypothetical protein